MAPDRTSILRLSRSELLPESAQRVGVDVEPLGFRLVRIDVLEPERLLRVVACDLASVSPKMRNSTPAADQFGAAWVRRHESARDRPEVIAAWLRGYEFQLKFVVADPGDLAEIDVVLARLPGGLVPPWKVLLMPEGTEAGVLAGRRDWLVGLCVERGFRYCERLQIEVFGNTRGT